MIVIDKSSCDIFKLNMPPLLFSFRFGPPFLMREDRSITWDQLQQSILSKLYYLMLNGSQAQVMAAPSKTNNMLPTLFDVGNLSP